VTTVTSELNRSIGLDFGFVTKSWLIPDMFQFENVGFSKTVGNYKYLVCADCEIGPIGWHCIDSQESYVADQRVKHME
jgi:hypothetical protein